MNEIVPGIFHWAGFHEGIGQRVSSYFVESASALIDPMIPDEGLDRLEAGRPRTILLTNRHHYRQSDRFVEWFGCSVHCERSGLYEFAGGPAVQGFSFGDEVAAGITALEMDAICTEDTALHIAAGHPDRAGVLAFADGLIRGADGALGFVPDRLMGDDPEEVKRGLRASLHRLLEEDFDALLFAHGEPMASGGKDALRRFLEAGV